jgi:hypothetical protein
MQNVLKKGKAYLSDISLPLPGDKLSVVYDFVSYLLDRETDQPQGQHSGAFHTMLASEAVLDREWDRPEEDAAWADL